MKNKKLTLNNSILPKKGCTPQTSDQKKMVTNFFAILFEWYHEDNVTKGNDNAKLHKRNRDYTVEAK
jgi:hypothetical protein